MKHSVPLKVGIIGLGRRTETLLASIFALSDQAEITYLCDLRPERIQRILDIFAEHGVPAPAVCQDAHILLHSDAVEAVLIPTSWNSHLPLAGAALRCGKYVGIEVGGAAAIEELWELVRASEGSGAGCMMLENCCYGRHELLALNLVRQGLFGELIHCECGYEHDLSEEMCVWLDEGIERATHNLRRNADLYPTHGLGPIAKILRINRGNRFLSLVSMATKARGLSEAVHRHSGKQLDFNNGDVVNTLIKCANGETISITHGIALPRPYSRDCRVQGTRGLWLENAAGVYVEGISPKHVRIDVAGNPYTVHEWSPIAEFYDRYDHPIWQDYRHRTVGEHGGMDALALQAFFAAASHRCPPPIDVYDVAAWMSVTALSEQSIALGSAPVPFPDFTCGKWIARESVAANRWNLDEVENLSE